MRRLAIVFVCLTACTFNSTTTTGETAGKGGGGGNGGSAGSNVPQAGSGGSPVVDAGQIDAGPSMFDAGQAPPDAGQMYVDAEIVGPIDAGVVVDAGVDAGTPAPATFADFQPDLLVLSSTTITQSQVLSARITYRNQSFSDYHVKEIVITARRPGATHITGPFDDFRPALKDITVPGKFGVTLNVTFEFTTRMPTGQWEVYATFKDDADAWHDGPSTFVTVNELKLRETFPALLYGSIKPGYSNIGSNTLVSRIRQVLRIQIGYGNDNSFPVEVKEIRLAARPPGGTHSGGPYLDFSPSGLSQTLLTSQETILTATRVFQDTDPTGLWDVYQTWRDKYNVWHDGLGRIVIVEPFNFTPEIPETFSSEPTVTITSVTVSDGIGGSKEITVSGTTDGVGSYIISHGLNCQEFFPDSGKISGLSWTTTMFKTDFYQLGLSIEPVSSQDSCKNFPNAIPWPLPERH